MTDRAVPSRSRQADTPEADSSPLDGTPSTSIFSPILSQSTIFQETLQSNELIVLRRQIELLERMLLHKKNQNNKLSDVYLPDYDPDSQKITVGEWCIQVDSLIDVRGISPSLALAKALSCLRGRAKSWAESNAHLYAQWTDVKTQLMMLFSGEMRYLRLVNKFRHYTSDDAASYAEYVNEAWRVFARISPNAPNDLMIEAVISGIRPTYYQAELLRYAPRTQAELICALYNYRKT